MASTADLLPTFAPDHGVTVLPDHEPAGRTPYRDYVVCARGPGAGTRIDALVSYLEQIQDRPAP